MEGERGVWPGGISEVRRVCIASLVGREHTLIAAQDVFLGWAMRSRLSCASIITILEI
jgi:hypothetical protein